MTADRIAYQRAYSGARQRAMARLVARHRGEYAALLAVERSKGESEQERRVERVAQLERERVRRPDDLEAERYAPAPAERGYWNRPTTPADRTTTE